MMARAEQAGREFTKVYLRRVLALAMFGAAHFIFLWEGDILFSYAVGALMLMVVLYGNDEAAPHCHRRCGRPGVHSRVGQYLCGRCRPCGGRANRDLPSQWETREHPRPRCSAVLVPAAVGRLAAHRRGCGVLVVARWTRRAAPAALGLRALAPDHRMALVEVLRASGQAQRSIGGQPLFVLRDSDHRERTRSAFRTRSGRRNRHCRATVDGSVRCQQDRSQGGCEGGDTCRAKAPRKPPEADKKVERRSQRKPKKSAPQNARPRGRSSSPKAKRIRRRNYASSPAVAIGRR